MIARPSTDKGAATAGYAPWALNDESAEQLWGLSQEWVDQRFHW